MTHKSALFYLLSFILALQSWAAGETLKVMEQDLRMTVDQNGNASITLTLGNSSNSPVPLMLSVSDFKHAERGGKDYLLGTTPIVAGASEADRSKLTKQQLGPGETVAVKITVAGLWEAGESTAQLSNAGQSLATLRALRRPAAYNVQIESQNEEAVLGPDSRAVITLINNDPMTYRFSWELVTLGKAGTDGKNSLIELPANGSARLDISAAVPHVSFLAAGTLKDQLEDATLVLHPILESQDGVPPLAPKPLPLKLRLRFWSSFSQQAIAFVLTSGLLLIGGLASLWSRYFIPNALGALKVRRQLRGMQEKLDGIGDDLASQWRVLLAWRFETCNRGLHEIPWAFPAFASRLTELQADAAMQNEWLEITYGVSLVLNDANKLVQTGIPPTVLQWIGEKCNEALQPIETGFTKPEELQNMKLALKTAQDYVQALKTAAPIKDLDDAIKEREASIQPALDQLRQGFPVFVGLLNQVAAAIGKAPSPATYLDRDTFSLKAELLQRYRDLTIRAGAAAFPPAMAAAAGFPGGGQGQMQLAGTALNRLIARDTKFKDYVEPDAYESLRIAQLFVTEMRQDFYTDALLAEIQKPEPALEIHAEPFPVKTGIPVHFSIRFLRDALNKIAAVQEWTCYWDFNDGSERQSGWDVYHRYSSAAVGNRKVSVTIVDLAGETLAPTHPIERSFPVTGIVPPTRRLLRMPNVTAEAKIEMWHLALVLVIALFGVYATARDKVEGLGVFEGAAAIIAIGFGADTLKNLITQKPPESK